MFLVDKGFHTLYRSVVLNIVNRSVEFIQTPLVLVLVLVTRDEQGYL